MCSMIRLEKNRLQDGLKKMKNGKKVGTEQRSSSVHQKKANRLQQADQSSRTNQAQGFKKRIPLKRIKSYAVKAMNSLKSSSN